MHQLTNNTRYRLICIIILVAVIAYYFFRSYLILSLVACYIIVALIRRSRHLCSIKFPQTTRWILALLITTFYLVFAYFNTRVDSIDGLNYSLRFAALVKDKGYVAILESPVRPYLGEMLLGFTWRFFGFRAMHLALGLWAVSSAFLAYKLFAKLFPTNVQLRKRGWLLFVLFSPF